MRLWSFALLLLCAFVCTAQIASRRDALAAFPADVRSAHTALKSAGEVLKTYYKQLNDAKILVKNSRQQWVKAHLNARNLKAARDVAQAQVTKTQEAVKLAQAALESHKRLAIAPAQSKVDADSVVKASWEKRKQVAEHNLKVHQQLTLKDASTASNPHIQKEMQLVNQWWARHQRHLTELQTATEQAVVLETAVKKAEGEFDAASRAATAAASEYETARRQSAGLFQLFKETFQKRKEAALQVIRQVRVVRRRIRAVFIALKRAVAESELQLKKVQAEVEKARLANEKDARDVKEAAKDVKDATKDFLEARQLLQDTHRSLKEAQGFFRASKKALSAIQLKVIEAQKVVTRYKFAVRTFTQRFPAATQTSGTAAAKDPKNKKKLKLVDDIDK